MERANRDANNLPEPDADADGGQRVALLRFVDVLARLDARRELKTLQKQREESPHVAREQL